MMLRLDRSKKSSKPPLPYRKELKKLLNEQLIDIILFGSVVKGGSPKDIDIALMLKDTTNLLTIKKKIKEIDFNESFFSEKKDSSALSIFSMSPECFIICAINGSSKEVLERRRQPLIGIVLE